jgi:hypothetical protein
MCFKSKGTIFVYTLSLDLALIYVNLWLWRGRELVQGVDSLRR